MTKQTRRPRRTLPAFEHALAEAWKDERAPRPKCDNNPKDYVDFEVGDRPTTEQAEALCSGCPLRQLCLANARHTKPAYGVYGGVVFIGGRQAQLMAPDDERLAA